MHYLVCIIFSLLEKWVSCESFIFELHKPKTSMTAGQIYFLINTNDTSSYFP